MTHPARAGLLPTAAIYGKLLRGIVTAAGRVFLVAAIGHGSGVVPGRRQVADKRDPVAVAFAVALDAGL